MRLSMFKFKMFLSLLFSLSLCSKTQAQMQRPSLVAPRINSEEVIIQGYVPHAEGRTLIWTIPSDLISNRPQEIGRVIIDSTGQFFLSSSLIKQTTPSYLAIDYYSTCLFVEPGTFYKLKFLDFDYHLDEKINAFIKSNLLPSLPFTFEKEDSAELNGLLWKYTQAYNRAMEDGFEQVIVNGDTKAINQFLDDCKKDFDYSGHQYFLTYMRYSLAELISFANIKSKQAIFNEYIKDQPIHYQNPAQIDFLTSFFQAYFHSQSKISPTNLKKLLNKENIAPNLHLKQVLDTLGMDTLLRNEVLREWVFIHAVHEIYGRETEYKEESLKTLLTELKNTTKFPEHAQIIENILKNHQEEKEKLYFKGIPLLDINQKTILIDSLLELGKFHYFVFLRADHDLCPEGVRESALLRKVWKDLLGKDSISKNQIEKSVKIIFIGCDYEFARFYHHAYQEKYPWPYLHFNQQIEWLRKIGAVHFPCFMLVDDQGHILEDNFQKPSQNIKATFIKMGKRNALFYPNSEK
ncbi:MAG: hypothetical protein RR084_07495 [Bacteroidales bacterium]